MGGRGGRAGRYKLGARTGKYKLGAKTGIRTGGQKEGRGPENKSKNNFRLVKRESSNRKNMNGEKDEF